MDAELSDRRAWAIPIGMPALLVAIATLPLVGLHPHLPPNVVWLGYLMLVVLTTVRWGLAGGTTAALIGGLAGDFFFTQPYYSLWMDDPRDVVALLLFLLAALVSAAVISGWTRAAPNPTSHAGRQTRQRPVAFADAALSRRWRTSLTTVLGAATVLQLRAATQAPEIERVLLADIVDEALNLRRILSEASESRSSADLPASGRGD